MSSALELATLGAAGWDTSAAPAHRFTNWTSATSDPTNADGAARGYYVGHRWFNTATGNEFYCVDATAGAAKWRHVPRLLAQSGTAVVAPANDTNENILATIALAANVIGLNGALVVESTWTYTNSANNKNLRTRLGGISGTVCMNLTLTTTANYSDRRRIMVRGAANSQTVSSSTGGTPGGLGTGTAALPTPAIDTTAAVDLVLTAQKATGSETVTLESYSVMLTRPDIT